MTSLWFGITLRLPNRVRARVVVREHSRPSDRKATPPARPIESAPPPPPPETPSHRGRRQDPHRLLPGPWRLHPDGMNTPWLNREGEVMRASTTGGRPTIFQKIKRANAEVEEGGDGEGSGERGSTENKGRECLGDEVGDGERCRRGRPGRTAARRGRPRPTHNVRREATQQPTSGRRHQARRAIPPIDGNARAHEQRRAGSEQRDHS